MKLKKCYFSVSMLVISFFCFADQKKEYLLGFTSLADEVAYEKLSVEGEIPYWLSGSFLCTGPAKFEVGDQKVSHHFDGFSALYNCSFHEGEVSFKASFLKSNYYLESMAAGKIVNAVFQDRTIFDRISIVFGKLVRLLFNVGKEPLFDNANINISTMADKYVALTETPVPFEFDKNTLESLGIVRFDDEIRGQVTTAHPHYDSTTRETFNYVTHFTRESSYNIYRLPDGSLKRELVASIPVSTPSYMHSFALTEHYIVLTEIPYVVNPLDLLITAKPFFENFVWKPEQKTTFTVISRKDGAVVERFITEPFFMYHHINAFEENNKIVIDLVTYPDPSVIERDRLCYYFDEDYSRGKQEPSTVRRFILDFDNKNVISHEISQANLIMPQINYKDFNTKEYSYAYFLGIDGDHDYYNQLVKLDMNSGDTKIWQADHCYPGEPVFVAAPDAKNEDDGVLLSIVLDAHKYNSFVVVLDAVTMKELGRAIIPVSVPFRLHGNFYPE